MSQADPKPQDLGPGNPHYGLQQRPIFYHLAQTWRKKSDLTSKHFFRMRLTHASCGTQEDKMFANELREHTLFKQLQQEVVDVYVSPHVYASPFNREDANISYFNCQFVDVDFYKVPALAQATADEVADAIIDRCLAQDIPVPSVFVDTGKGLLLIWNYERPLTAKSRPRWQATQRQLIRHFRDLGADPAGETPKFFRLLGSINSKTGRRVSIVREFAAKDGWIACYRPEDLFRVILEDRGIHVAVRERKIRNYEKTGRRWKHEKQLREEKRAALRRDHEGNLLSARKRVLYLDALRMPVREDRFRFEWLRNALEDIPRLIQTRWNGQIPEGQRDMFLLHYACLAAQLHQPERLMPVLRDFAARFLDEHFARKHLLPSLKTLLRRAEQTAAGERSIWRGKSLTRVYTYSKERIIHELGITLEEMSGLRGLIDETIRQKRKVEARKASRRAAGVRSRQEYLADSLSQERPWEALGVSRATYYRKQKAEGTTEQKPRETSLTPTLNIMAKPGGRPGQTPTLALLVTADDANAVIVPFPSPAKAPPSLPDVISHALCRGLKMASALSSVAECSDPRLASERREAGQSLSSASDAGLPEAPSQEPPKNSREQPQEQR